MKKIFSIIFAVLIFANFIFAAEAEKYGKELTLDEKTSIGEITATPEAYEGKTVQVEGKITGVCEKMGCWIVLSDEKDNMLKVKVNDGEIVFPMESMGKNAIVEGEIYAIETEAKSDCSEAHAEKAEAKSDCSKVRMEKAVTEKEDGCCSKKKVAKVYQLKGISAIIN